MAVAISGRVACIMAWKLAAASSSETFLAMMKPSHQSAAAGIVPPPMVGAAAKTVFSTTSGLAWAGSIRDPASEPQLFSMATLPSR